MEIRFTAEAEALAKSFRRKARLKSKTESNNKTGLNPIYNRTYEHACKIALVATEEDVIIAEVFEWASELTWFLSESMAVKVNSHISENSHEAEFKKVLNIIHEYGTFTLTKLGEKTRFLRDSRRRGEIIDGLIDTGEVLSYIVNAQNSKKPTQHLFCGCGEHPELEAVFTDSLICG